MADLRYPVELAGRGFLVSRRGGRYGRRSIPLQKAQQDTSDLPGEQSLNPDDLWRRSFESWHRGAGQNDFDWADSDPFRFRSSWGVDPWTRRRLGLLNETESKLASTESSVKLVAAGGYLYCADGQTLKFTDDILAAGVATWTTVTGTPAADVTAVTSDGYNVWVAFGASGVYRTTRGAASAAIYNSLDCDALAFVKGRLMASKDQRLFNITQASGSVAIRWSSLGIHSVPNLSTYDVTRQSPVVEGDLMMVLFVVSDADASITPPSGWSQRVAKQGTASDTTFLFTKIAGGSEPTTYTFTFSEAITAAWTQAAYSGVDPLDPIDDVQAQLNASSTSLTAPSVDIEVAGSVAIFIATAQDSIDATSSPAGYTEEGEDILQLSWHWADKTYTAVGATGAVAATATTARENVGIHMVLRPEGTAPLFEHPNTDFAWVGFAEGQGDIYAAGYSGDKSLVYRTQIRADGTALDAPVVAGSLPDGEIIRSIYGYLGILFIGTDNGVRMAVSDANGDLTIGALITTSSPVRCFEGQGRYVWFGLEDFDISRWSAGTQDGLGRLDLTQQVEQLVPAWTSDLMVAASTSTTESVQSVVTFQDRRVLAIGSSNGLSRGVYAEKANKVASGYLDSGLISYGIADSKNAVYLDVRHRPLTGTMEAYVSADEGAFSSVGTSTTASSTRPATDPMSVGSIPGDTHEVRVKLNRLNAADATGPSLTKITLRSNPAVSRGRIYQWPILITRALSVQGQEVTANPAEALAYIEALLDAQELITCREGNSTFSAFVQDFEFIGEHLTDDRKAEQGICTVTLKVPGA